MNKLAEMAFKQTEHKSLKIQSKPNANFFLLHTHVFTYFIKQFLLLVAVWSFLICTTIVSFGCEFF